jgi:hypothetical protein
VSGGVYDTHPSLQILIKYKQEGVRIPVKGGFWGRFKRGEGGREQGKG